MNKLLTALFIIATHSLLAQPSLRDLENYMGQVRTNTTAPVPASILSDVRNEDNLIASLLPYFSDSVAIVRAKAFYIAKRIGHKSTKASVRNTTITNLIKAISDKDTGISGNASEALTGFSKTDFTAAHKGAIDNLLSLQTPHLDVLLRLAGYLEMHDQRGKINDIVNSNTAFKNKWAARLALARMGDGSAIQYIMGKLSNAPVNDDMIYDVVPDLVYSRQKEIFSYLVQLINSDKAECQSANPDSEQKILCGYRVMEYISPAIQNFPLKVDESGDLDVTDYTTALTTVRSWFTQNPAYVILMDSY